MNKLRVVLILLILSWSIWYLDSLEKACTDKDGVLVRDIWTLRCLYGLKELK